MDRAFAFDVTCPANTPMAAPVTSDISIPPGYYVKWIQIVIPDGHAGVTGIAIAQGHGIVLPYNGNTFIEGNDEEPKFEFTDDVGSGSWQAVMYNLDIESQSWQVRIGVSIHTPAEPLTSDASSTVDALSSSLTDLGQGTDTTQPPDLSQPPDITPPDTGQPPDAGLPAPPDTGEPPPPDDGSTAPPDVPDGTLPPDVPDQTPPDLGAPPDLSIAPVDTSGGAPSSGGAPPRGRRFPSGGAPVAPGTHTTYVTRTQVEPVYGQRTYPAGGWLPPGARFTVERIDQGQDFITDWQGPVIAPGDGHVVEVLSDRPFPDGFGPGYPVVQIDTGRWAGRTLYIGHTSTAVRAGQTFKTGTVLAHADQGHVSGGGWVELGEASALGQGIHDQGAAIAGMFGPVTVRVQTGTRRVTVRVPVKVAGPPARKPPAKKPAPAGRQPAAPGKVTGGHRPTSHPPSGGAPPSGRRPPAPPRRPAPAPHTGGAAPAPPRRPAPAPPPPRPEPRRAPPPPPPPPRPPEPRRAPPPPPPAPRRGRR